MPYPLRRRKMVGVYERKYYVDATGGSDANSGLSPTGAWQTIGKVNGYTFEAEDEILFKRGETWVGTCLTIPSDSLTFTAYGAGAKPIIDGNDLVNCVQGNSRDNLLFQDIEVTQGLNFGFVFDTESNIALIDCDAHDCGNDNLIFDNCNHCSVFGGHFYNSYQRVPGWNCSGIEIADGSYNIELTGVTCFDNTGVGVNSGMGITVHSHGPTIMPYNITIDGAICYGNTDCGVLMWKQDAVVDGDRNNVIENCYLHTNTDGAIKLDATAGAGFPLNGVTIRDNELSYNTNNQQFEVRTSNHVSFYRNLVKNNNNDVGAQNINIVDTKNISIFNNTTYSEFNGFWFSMNIIGAVCENVQVKNNIIGTAIANIMHVAVAATVTPAEVDIDYNLYQYVGAGNRWSWLGGGVNYAGWQAVNSNDANSPARADPLFVNPATNDFTLQAGSPAIDAGVDVGLPYLGTAPDCGYAERE